MRRPLRRFHLLIWLILAPAVLAAGAYALTLRPATPYDAPPVVPE
ncbi:MAG: hypothetical protein AAGC56_08995 [Pseudomonadota bacterium]